MDTSRWVAGFLVLAYVLGAASTTPAQRDPRRGKDSALVPNTEPNPASVLAPLRDAHLIIWRVTDTRNPTTRATLPDLGYREQTAGSFGTAASDAGRAASDVGTTSGTFGTTASDAGQNASTHGQTAGSFGRPSSEVGQTAGSYGKSPSELGPGPGSRSVSAGDYGQPAANYGQPSSGPRRTASSAPRATPTTNKAAQADELLTTLGSERPAVPSLEMGFVTVAADELGARLQATQNTDDYPDLVIGDPLPKEWTNPATGLRSIVGIESIGSLGISRPSEKTQLHFEDTVQVGILARAQHRQAAQAYVVWLRDAALRYSHPNTVPKLQADAVRVATRAARGVLLAGSIGEHDPDLSKFSAQAASLNAWQPTAIESLNDLNLRVDVVDAQANDRMAVVALRVIGSSQRVFGVVHSLVMLRRGDDAQWKVLQVTPNISPELLSKAFSALAISCVPIPPARFVDVKGITQAAPFDGDVRPRVPDMWWDNTGDAQTLAVEWQTGASGVFGETHLDLLTNNVREVHTRVPASFAFHKGDYRWRVWSLGLGGALTLSPWRTFVVLQ